MKSSIGDIRVALSTSAKVELGWYQNSESSFLHTGLALIFDDKPQFTIDYGTESGTWKYVKVPGGKKVEFI